jgi:hypothetical protein
MKQEVKQEIKVCDCGCGIFRIAKYDWNNGDVDYGISLYKDEFYNGQNFIIKSLLTRIKHAWFTLLGKDYWLFDISLSKEQFEEFKDNLSKL